MTRPSPKEIKIIADVAGIPVNAETAERIGNSIGPAFDGFAAISGLPGFVFTLAGSCLQPVA